MSAGAGVTWTGGAILPEGASVFEATDRGAILGDGLFETLRVAGARPVFLDAHLARMARGAAALDLAFPEATIRAGVAAACAGGEGPGVLRVTVTRGPGGRGLAPIARADQRPRIVVRRTPAPPRGEGAVTAVLSSVRREPSAPSCRHKTLSYADAAFARAEAARAGAEDAVMLSTTGRAACFTIGNLWALTPDGYVTPPLAEGVLPGIARAALLAEGRAGGAPVREARLDADDLSRFPLFRSNSVAGVDRVRLAGGAAPASDNPLGLLYEALEAREAA